VNGNAGDSCKKKQFFAEGILGAVVEAGDVPFLTALPAKGFRLLAFREGFSSLWKHGRDVMLRLSENERSLCDLLRDA
jgi:hypothetical protein